MSKSKKELCVEYKAQDNGFQVIIYYRGKIIDGGFLTQLPFLEDELTNPSKILERERPTYGIT